MKESWQVKLKRELLEAKQQLFEVCNNPDSFKSKSIISEQKFLKQQGDMFMNGHSYYEKLKELGFGLQPKVFIHYEKEI